MKVPPGAPLALASLWLLLSGVHANLPVIHPASSLHRPFSKQLHASYIPPPSNVNSLLSKSFFVETSFDAADQEDNAGSGALSSSPAMPYQLGDFDLSDTTTWIDRRDRFIRGAKLGLRLTMKNLWKIAGFTLLCGVGVALEINLYKRFPAIQEAYMKVVECLFFSPKKWLMYQASKAGLGGTHDTMLVPLSSLPFLPFLKRYMSPVGWKILKLEVIPRIMCRLEAIVNNKNSGRDMSEEDDSLAYEEGVQDQTSLHRWQAFSIGYVDALVATLKSLVHRHAVVTPAGNTAQTNLMVFPLTSILAFLLTRFTARAIDLPLFYEAGTEGCIGFTLSGKMFSHFLEKLESVTTKYEQSLLARQ